MGRIERKKNCISVHGDRSSTIILEALEIVTFIVWFIGRRLLRCVAFGSPATSVIYTVVCNGVCSIYIIVGINKYDCAIL